MDVRLEKKSIDPLNDSAIPVGYIQEGTVYNFKKQVEIKKINDIKVGDQIVVKGDRGFSDYIRTSEIHEIIKKDDHSITFKTKTSTYRMDIVDTVFEQ